MHAKSNPNKEDAARGTQRATVNSMFRKQIYEPNTWPDSLTIYSFTRCKIAHHPLREKGGVAVKVAKLPPHESASSTTLQKKFRSKLP